MSIVLNGTTGITTPALDSVAQFSSADMPAGSVLQVVSNTTETRTTISGTTFVDVLSLSITPQSSSSKIVLACQFNGVCDNRYGAVKLYRNATQIAASTTNVESRTPVWFSLYGNHEEWGANGWVYTQQTHSGQYVDSPSTTSAITYKITAGNTLNAGSTVVVNGMTNGDNNEAWNHRTITSLIAMEIAV